MTLASFLRSDFGWDGRFPIPVTYYGCATLKQLDGINVVAFDGDNKCVWCADEESAALLVREGHFVLQLDSAREQFLRNKELREQYPHWEN